MLINKYNNKNIYIKHIKYIHKFKKKTQNM